MRQYCLLSLQGGSERDGPFVCFPIHFHLQHKKPVRPQELPALKLLSESPFGSKPFRHRFQAHCRDRSLGSFYNNYLLPHT